MILDIWKLFTVTLRGFRLENAEYFEIYWDLFVMLCLLSAEAAWDDPFKRWHCLHTSCFSHLEWLIPADYGLWCFDVVSHDSWFT